MATEVVDVIDGGGLPDTVTVTDDPVEDATVESVKQGIGDETTASEQADSTVAATLLERVTALVDVLTSGQADDEVRVALATDLLTGNLDVNLSDQSGNIEVDLAADSLAGSLDVDLAEVSHGTVETTDDGNFVISDIPATASEGAALPGTAVVVAGDDGTDTHLFQLRGDDLKVSVENDQIDLPTETTLSAVQSAVEAIDDALESNATDTLRVSSPSDLDVNLNADSLASALDVDLAGQSAAPIQIELSSDALAGNLDVDLAAASAQPLDVSASTVPVEQQTPVGVEDSGGTQIDPATSSDVEAVESAVGDEATASQQADSTLSATLIERVTALVDALTSGQADDELRVALATDLLSGNLDIDVAEQSAGNIAVELAADSLTGNLDVDLAAQTSGALDVSGATVPTEQQTPVKLESSGGTTIDPATETTLADIKSAAQALNDALASNATDEIRVTSPSPLDVSASEVDVNLNSQTLTNVSVDLNAQSGPALDVSGATVTVTDDGALTLAANDGTDIGDVGIENISPVTGQATKSGSLPVTLASDEDTVNVQEDTALDVSGAEIDIDLNSQSLSEVSVDLASDSLAGNLDVDLAAASAEPLDVSAATVTVQEDTALDVSAAEVDVDLASQTGPALDVSAATVAVQEASALDVSAATVEVQEATALDVSGATVPTEPQSPVKVEDSSGAAIDPATEQKLESVRALLDKLDDALTSVGSDEVRATIENGASPVAFPDTGRRTVSTAGSPESLASAPAPVASGVEVKAMPGNTGTAFIFISGESKADSYPLAPGDEVFMPVDDASKVIVDVGTGGDTVAFIAA